MGSLWSWSYNSWIYNYLSLLTLWVWTPLRRSVLDTTLCDKVCQWLVASLWFSPGTLLSSTNKTDHHNITQILLKVTLNTITPTLQFQIIYNSDNFAIPVILIDDNWRYSNEKRILSNFWILHRTKKIFNLCQSSNLNPGINWRNSGLFRFLFLICGVCLRKLIFDFIFVQFCLHRYHTLLFPTTGEKWRQYLTWMFNYRNKFVQRYNVYIIASFVLF